MRIEADQVDGLLSAVERFINERGGELEQVEELRRDLLRGRAGATESSPAVAERVLPSRHLARARDGEWLRPDAAGVKYSDVWICETASGGRVLVHVASHRRRNGRNLRERPRWYGVDILTGREVRIARVLQGSRR